MDLGLQDKSVIVCASSGGLGYAAALAFAREGARVMLASSNESKLAKAAASITAATGRAPHFTVSDITRPDDCQRLIDRTVDAFGGIYTLINNTGGPPAGGFAQFDDAAWIKAFNLTLLSYVRTTRAALPHLLKSSGRIVNFASSSTKAALDNLILSNTFRMGVVGLSKSIATEFGDRGLLINILGPGRIATDRITQLDAIRAGKAGTSPEQVQAEAIKQIPLGRYGTPEEFGQVSAFLGSPANTFLTGQSILVDGGMIKAY